MERTRRGAAGAKLDRLAQLRAARQGQARSKQWKDDDDDDLYDEVDEDQYKSIVRGRLQRDDFIEDDDGGGYADNGMDDWDSHAAGEPMDEDTDRERKPKNSKAPKVTKSDKSKIKPAPSNETEASSSAAYRRVVAPEKEADFMSNLFSALDAKSGPSTKPKPRPLAQQAHRRKRKSSPDFDTSSEFDVIQARNSSVKRPLRAKAEPPLEVLDTNHASSSEWEQSSPTHPPKRFKTEADVDSKVTRQVSNLKFEEPDEFDALDSSDMVDLDMAFIQEDEPSPVKTLESNIKYIRPEEKPKKEENGAPAWLAFHSTLLASSTADNGDEMIGTSGANLPSDSSINALEDDGSLHMFWLDYTESNGKLYLSGKVLDKGSDGKGKKYVSCMLTVEGLERNLFVLPREKRVEDDFVTDLTPSKEDVYRDFDAMRRQVKIKSFGGKWVQRKYAFGTEGIPEGESEWLKVVYGFDQPSMPEGLSSPNIAAILGTRTNAFELFVLKRKIKGPCWLRIQSPELKHQGISWCKMEVTVKDPKNVNPFSQTDDRAPRQVPPLTIMSLAVRSVVNHQLNKREIVTGSVRVWENNKIDDPTPPEQQPSSSHTIVRPLGKYPSGFEAKARSQKSKLIAAPNEKALLGDLLTLMQRYDPDVVVGHELIGDHIETILHRLKDLKIEHWSRIGRIRRSNNIAMGRQGTNIKFLAGRLICDLTSDAAKGMISSTTWSLTEMCNNQLKQQREDIDPDDTAMYFDGAVKSPDSLLRFVKHCEMDAFFQMAIACKVQILPLTRELTNLAGNSWHKTLTGGRSERNEYILLHEFHRLKYICPDKTWGKRDAVTTAKVEAEEMDGEVPVSKKEKGKSKDKYKGGLVFEPKRGLWDKYILVMDFNSLYPSIIQEYNIDFTTVAKVEDEDEIPEVPPTELEAGVLPRLIATLVKRRREVKKLMKDRSATPAKMMQWDIQQQALKLTANSMYGCLGFTQSRFYARPLAALTTYKGREILTHTKELAESLNLEVVYGDTDSVFVNSNVTDLAEALKTANQFKKLVNERYKLLEIDLDGIFQRLLLLQKKKYAALKVDDGGKTTTEIKGLDMKRREFSPLSKNVSDYVLRQILSGEATEVAVEAIHEYLTHLGQEIREGRIPLEDYIINKRLGKNPEDYPDAKSQPHVQVALRLKAKGATPRGGDVIQYIFCLGDDGTSSKSAQADHARHPDEIRRANGELKIDFEYYLASQILPPIARLCELIEGTDRSRLAECLGLNPDQYASTVAAPSNERALGILDSQIPDAERYKETDPFNVICGHCSAVTTFLRLVEAETHILTSAGPQCPSCHTAFLPAVLNLQLESQIREHVTRFYEGWMVCDDHTCGTRTRMMSVYGTRCLRNTCRGVVSFEYSGSMLYNQLLMYSTLFDADKAWKAAETSQRKDELQSILVNNNILMTELRNVVNTYLNRNGRRWVDLGTLFSFMTVF